MPKISQDTLADIAAGRATDDQLAELVSPDTMNELAAQWRTAEETDREFYRWHAAVMRPIGADEKASYAMFTGAITIDDFAASLPEDVLDAFLERFETLQADYAASRTRPGGDWGL